MMDLNKLAAQLHEAAVAKGFWDVENAEEKALVNMHCELSEAIQEDRCGRPMLYVDDIEAMERVTDIHAFDGRKPEGAAVELADFVMRVLDWCGKFELELPDCSIEEYYEVSDEFLFNGGIWLLVGVLHMQLSKLIYDVGDSDAIILMIYAPYMWLKHRGFDLIELIELKMEYNKSRPRLHGRAY